MLNKKWQ